ncbi:hypothetical protein Anapl_10349 [Anas platyrhynchos]|uniref:Uncharacterized protein n=1 Tax=Anas platyrhynchos TaxID=8839 RepID=R0KUG1_ANAPL|nr:hypothetical protein Anapl_10349 [Anas platyrhynchos]
MVQGIPEAPGRRCNKEPCGQETSTKSNEDLNNLEAGRGYKHDIPRSGAQCLLEFTSHVLASSKFSTRASLFPEIRTRSWVRMAWIPDSFFQNNALLLFDKQPATNLSQKATHKTDFLHLEENLLEYGVLTEEQVCTKPLETAIVSSCC